MKPGGRPVPEPARPPWRDGAQLPLASAAVVLLIPFISWGTIPWLSGPVVLLTACVFAAELRKRTSGEGVRIPGTPVWLPLAMVLGLGLLHLFRSPVPYSSVLFLVHMSLAASFYWLWWSQGPVITPLAAALVWTGILVPWVVVQGLLGGSGAPHGPFLNPNYTATVLLVCLAVLLGRMLSPGQGKGYTTATMTAAWAASGALMLIGSRSAGLGLALLWVAFLFFGKGRMRWVALLVVALLLLLPNTIRYRVTEGYKADPHAFSRIRIWAASLEMGADHPLVGVGPGLFHEYAPVYAFPTEDLPVRYGRIARKPHNEYLRSWAEGGAVGALAAGLFLLMAVSLMVRGFREGRQAEALSAGAICFQALFHDVTEVLALVLLMAWCLARLTPERGRRLRDGTRTARLLQVAAGALVLGLAVWLNLDLASRTLWLKGRDLMGSDVPAARDRITAATRLNPLLPGAMRDLARTRLMLSLQQPDAGSRELAERTIEAAHRLNSLDTVPLRMRAALRAGSALTSPDADGYPAGAVADLERALTMEPHNALIWLNLSELYWDLGQREKALGLARRALEEEPNYLQAHRTLIGWLQEVDPGKVMEARSGLAMAAERAAGYRPIGEYEEIILR